MKPLDSTANLLKLQSREEHVGLHHDYAVSKIQIVWNCEGTAFVLQQIYCEEKKEMKVEIREYNIIYKMLEDIEDALRGTLAPVFEEVVYGHAEVRSLFKASKVGQIAGCMVLDGSLKSNCDIRVFREDSLVLKTHLTSLKRFKDDAREVLTGFECGLTISDNFTLKEGDILEAFGQEEVKNG